MRNPPPDRAEERPSPEARRQRVMRAALLRPGALLVVVVGTVFFAIMLAWWILPLTLATYAALVFLAARDPFFRSAVLEGRPITRSGFPTGLPGGRDVPPERRARWLPRGETRRKVEEALEIQRRTVFGIEESGDVARAVLDDAVPKLHRVAERLVDVALMRERVAGAIQDLNASNAERSEARTADLEDLERELRAADAEISDAFEKLSTLRARVVRVSVENESTVQNAATELNTDLDELNLRLEALRSTLSSPE